MPTTASEYITALAHYHRAEIARMAGWRDRIDRTTNWAITGGGAMLSVSLSSPSSHHGVLLFTMLLVLLFLIIEARRYRFFDVYRARVRLVERNYFSPLFLSGRAADPEWAHALGRSLDNPKFMVSLHSAMSRRLRRNYFWIFLVILVAWALKLSTPKLQDVAASRDVVTSLREMADNAALGFLPGWFVLIAVAMFYSWLVLTAVQHREPLPGDGDVHV
ncbi:DUF2270 domain-containing protein [Mesorhizobium sp. LHD-90]|uniref:DUF2270 domain-containing protein n=1 Tax=Mesorhizobium sp. LHD-90 TaxID=3071414 RepID=UPI0027E068DC|nr:DUF2270 domain-containing protein [Mesorhizobium sp. LHD-90]MDQ6435035.1 DUF2270 domain-containing protein [Mesorhizobium sp. LHD-90]